jgi:hypothetical protein
MSVIRFGEFELDEQTLELSKHGVLTRIQQQLREFLRCY